MGCFSVIHLWSWGTQWKWKLSFYFFEFRLILLDRITFTYSSHTYWKSDIFCILVSQYLSYCFCSYFYTRTFTTTHKFLIILYTWEMFHFLEWWVFEGTEYYSFNTYCMLWHNIPVACYICDPSHQNRPVAARGNW